MQRLLIVLVEALLSTSGKILNRLLTGLGACVKKTDGRHSVGSSVCKVTDEFKIIRQGLFSHSYSDLLDCSWV